MIESILVLLGIISVVCVFGGCMFYLLGKGLISMWKETRYKK